MLELPAGTATAVVVFVFGPQVTVGADGTAGTDDDVDLRDSFTATLSGAPLVTRPLIPNGVSVEVPVQVGANRLIASVEGVVAENGLRTLDTDRLVLLRRE